MLNKANSPHPCLFLSETSRFWLDVESMFCLKEPIGLLSRFSVLNAYLKLKWRPLKLALGSDRLCELNTSLGVAFLSQSWPMRWKMCHICNSQLCLDGLLVNECWQNYICNRISFLQLFRVTITLPMSLILYLANQTLNRFLIATRCLFLLFDFTTRDCLIKPWQRWSKSLIMSQCLVWRGFFF